VVSLLLARRLVAAGHLSVLGPPSGALDAGPAIRVHRHPPGPRRSRGRPG